MASVKLSDTKMRALEGVRVGMVRYLCLKNTELQILVQRESLMYTLWQCGGNVPMTC